MSLTLALLCVLLLFLLFLLLLRPTLHFIPHPPPQTVHATHSRWPSSLQKRKPSTPDSPCHPQPSCVQTLPTTSVDQFGRILPPSPMQSPSKSSRRLSAPLRLSFTNRRRSSSASYTSTLIHLDEADTRATSPLSSISISASQSPLRRTKFLNPFSKHTRSRTLSPPSTFKRLDDLSSDPSSPERRRTLIGKVKSIFKSKSVLPEPPPITHPKPTLATISSRLRRKPVGRTQPYGPPWNAPMPIPEWSLSQHSFQKPSRTSPSPHTGRKSSDYQGSCLESTSTSPGQLSPRTFVNELDEKLSLLREQCIQDLIPSPHG